MCRIATCHRCVLYVCVGHTHLDGSTPFKTPINGSVSFDLGNVKRLVGSLSLMGSNSLVVTVRHISLCDSVEV